MTNVTSPFLLSLDKLIMNFKNVLKKHTSIIERKIDEFLF